MTPSCPQCLSSRVVTRDYARKATGIIGAVAGAASSFGASLKGARAGGWAGGRVGSIAGPTGMTLGAITGAILGALAGGAAGCSAGSVLGELIDDKILDNYRCLDCKHTFASAGSRAPRRSPSDNASAQAYGIDPFDLSEGDEPFSLPRT